MVKDIVKLNYAGPSSLYNTTYLFVKEDVSLEEIAEFLDTQSLMYYSVQVHVMGVKLRFQRGQLESLLKPEKQT